MDASCFGNLTCPAAGRCLQAVRMSQYSNGLHLPCQSSACVRVGVLSSAQGPHQHGAVWGGAGGLLCTVDHVQCNAVLHAAWERRNIFQRPGRQRRSKMRRTLIPTHVLVQACGLHSTFSTAMLRCAGVQRTAQTKHVYAARDPQSEQSGWFRCRTPVAEHLM